MSLTIEAGALSAYAIVVAQTAPRLSGIPGIIKWVHWLVLGIYSLVGAEGLRFFVGLIFNNKRFMELFSQPNALAASPSAMQWLASGFSIVGAIFAVAVLRLGRFRRWARSTFAGLVIPVSALCPIVVLTAAGLGGFPATRRLTLIAVTVMVALASFSILFYRSSAVTSRIPFE